MNSLDYIVNKVLDAIRKDNRKHSAGSDDSGVVKRIDGNIAWVQLDKNSPQITPVTKSINCHVGDTVRLRRSNGSAFLVGNDSAPPTDDTKAEHAQTTADVADKTAKDAQLVASEAIEDAEHTAQYFWYRDGDDSEAGAHVTEVPQEDFEADPQGGNLLMRTEGIAVRDGTTKLAQFLGTGTIIGKEDELNVQVNNNGMGFYNGSRNYLKISNLSGFPIGGIISAKSSSSNEATLTAISAGANTNMSMQATDGNNKASIEVDAQSSTYLQPYGYGPYVKAISTNGTNTYRIAVTPTGVRGDLESPTVSISATTGTLVSAEARRFGQVVQLWIQFRNTASIAAGANVFEGTLNTTGLRPVLSSTGAGFFGTHSLVGYLPTTGALVVRNASSTAITINNTQTASVSFTYLVA